MLAIAEFARFINMRTEAEIMVIRANAYRGLCAQPMTQWWREMFIGAGPDRALELIFNEKPHLRVKGN